VALNTFVTTKISYANMLAQICEQMEGGDVDAVTSALGLDSRIGPKYLKGSLGYGGPCFPRDNVALSYLAREVGTQATLAETTDAMNRTLADRIIERLRPRARSGATIAVLGLAYKPFSSVIEESQGIYLARALARAGAWVVGFDPLANESARAALGDEVAVLNSIKECLARADIVLITTPDPVFRTLSAADFNAHRPVQVIDFWRILDKQLAGRASIRYIPVGRSVEDGANAMRLAELWGNPSLAAD
jgi:UDPglucose 6-dehydrogenase